MKRSSFTLVELLVVVGIIGVLAALVVPTLNTARATSLRTKCLANQGQVTKTILPVMAENNNFLVSGNSKSASGTSRNWLIYLATTNRVQDLTAFRCPLLPYDTGTNLTELSDSDKADACAEAYGVVTSTESSSQKKLPGESTKSNGFDFRGSTNLLYSKKLVSTNMLALGACCATLSGNDLKATSYGLDFSKDKKGAAAMHANQINMFFLDGHADSFNKNQYKTFYYPTGKDAQKIKENSWFDPNNK